MRKSIKTVVGGKGLKTRRSGEKVNTDLCAAFSNGALRDNGYMISGNAWNLNDADIIYSGYDGLNKPATYSRNAVLQYNNQASNNILKNFDSTSQLNKDSIYAVNMYYKGSPAQETAYNEGRDNMAGTHTGYLQFNPDNNRWEVTHNIHGTLVVSPFTLILGGGKLYGVTAILLPRKNNLVNKVRHVFGFKKGGELLVNEINDMQFSNQSSNEYNYLNNFRSLDEIKESMQPKISPPYDIQTPLKPTEYYALGSGNKDYSSYLKYVGYNEFSRAFDEVELEMPEASLYRELLTKIAEHESGFNKKVKNKAGSPAYGYFLLMEKEGKWNNITKYAGTDIETFRKDPKLQIKAAIKLALAFLNQFSLDDINKALKLGISISGMIGGAWLAGAGGVKKYLNGKGDSSDSHWSKQRKGDKVSKCLIRYNDL